MAAAPIAQTTAIFLRIVAEHALEEIDCGVTPDAVTPFWRVITPGSTIATKLSCDSVWLQQLRQREGIVDPLPGEDGGETMFAPRRRQDSHASRTKAPRAPNRQPRS
jgi:hypothetical protein